MLVSVTRLRVRRLWHLPAFLWQTFRANRQVAAASGFHGGRLLIDKRLTFWTLTTWEDERAMKSFRGSGAHAQVMPRLFHWCDEAAYVHWTATENNITEWPEAFEHLVREGRLSRVEHPSSDHTERKFPEPRLKPMIGQEIRPTPNRNAA